jgi:hypothetical protein
VRVYKVEHDHEYQLLLPVREGDVELLECDCSRKSDEWRPPPVNIAEPELRKGNFFHFDSDALICDDRCLEVLGEFFRRSGEVLDPPHEAKMYHLINVTSCIDRLDRRNAKYDVVGSSAQGELVLIKKYAFHRDRLLDSGLFKIPEESVSSILLVEGFRKPQLEFRSLVRTAGLTGLTFELVWSES